MMLNILMVMLHVCLVAQSCPTLCESAACQVPLSMEFSRQEYWSKLPFPPPGNLPSPGIEPMYPVSPALGGRFFTSSVTGEDIIIAPGKWDQFKKEKMA